MVLPSVLGHVAHSARLGLVRLAPVEQETVVTVPLGLQGLGAANHTAPLGHPLLAVLPRGLPLSNQMILTHGSARYRRLLAVATTVGHPPCIAHFQATQLPKGVSKCR